jgi:outer membrane protein OmpA-like peptidoglycan-associated protein
MWENVERLKFASGSAKLPGDVNAQVDQIAAMLKGDPDLHITIAGFPGNLVSPSEQLRVSRSRADSVKNALVARGIAPDRITAQGLGEKDPLATVIGRAANRRVSVRLTLPAPPELAGSISSPQ